MAILLLQCPRCKQRMKYGGGGFFLVNKRKVCVYCGHSFKIKENIIEKLEK
ncbi:MAG: hypothetical protein N3D84_01125 [Candidatus Woesearchaeota archaeon]|nr:hypothetical protein [Candidatus Woesearchaeota archaeon]